jgi:hypothetical protein
MTDSTPSSPRHKGGAPRGNTNSLHHGAPRGNTNAARHGFYSHWFTNQEHKRLDRDFLGQLDDEEDALNILIDRIFASMENEKLDHDRVVVASRAVSLMVGRIESIHRSRKAIYDNQTTIDKAIEELKYIPVNEETLEENRSTGRELFVPLFFQKQTTNRGGVCGAYHPGALPGPPWDKPPRVEAAPSCHTRSDPVGRPVRRDDSPNTAGRRHESSKEADVTPILNQQSSIHCIVPAKEIPVGWGAEAIALGRGGGWDSQAFRLCESPVYYWHLVLQKGVP